MYELKKIGKVFTSKFFGTGPLSYKRIIYRAAVSQRFRNTDLESLCLKHTKVYIKIFKILRIHFVSHFLVTMCGILLQALALTYSVPISITFVLIEEQFQFQSEILKLLCLTKISTNNPRRWAIFMNCRH